MFYNWKELKIGDWQFNKLVRASDGLVLFEKRSEEFTGLCFTAEEDNSTIQLTKVGSAPTVSLMKSDDGVIWSSYAQGDIITFARAGDKVYFKNSTTVTQLAASENNYNNFVMTGKIAASGNIMSLLSPDFDGELTMGAYCFSYLFQNCSSLTTAPEMLATSFNGQSFLSMFYGCSSLQQIKVHFQSWPATNNSRTWVNRVSSTGTFICPAELPDVRGVNNIPTGWTKQDLLT